MRRRLQWVFLQAMAIVALLVVSSCNATKHVPDGKYLLNKVHIEVDDNSLNKKELKNYLRQTPNHEILGGVKFQLAIYNWSGKDSTKWYNKWVRKLGQAPVIYDPSLTEASKSQLRLALVNKGYMDAIVEADTVSKGKKMQVDYRIKAGEPHYINSLEYEIPDDTIRSLIFQDSTKLLLKEKALFDRNVMEQERVGIADRLRYNGYFGFSKDYITYTADTTENSKAVDLVLKVKPPYQNRIEGYEVHEPFFIRKVYVITDFDPSTEKQLSNYRLLPSEEYKGVNIIYGEEKYLRANIIDDNCFIKVGEKYNSTDVDRTYQSFGRLGILKYINISFETVGREDGRLMLDAFILLTKGKSQTVSVSLEGTNSEGDLGFGIATTYQHRNIARGSETLSAKLGINYELIIKD